MCCKYETDQFRWWHRYRSPSTGNRHSGSNSPPATGRRTQANRPPQQQTGHEDTLQPLVSALQLRTSFKPHEHTAFAAMNLCRRDTSILVSAIQCMNCEINIRLKKPWRVSQIEANATISISKIKNIQYFTQSLNRRIHTYGGRHRIPNPVRPPSTNGIGVRLAPRVGLEPTTERLTAACSTN